MQTTLPATSASRSLDIRPQNDHQHLKDLAAHGYEARTGAHTPGPEKEAINKHGEGFSGDQAKTERQANTPERNETETARDDRGECRRRQELCRD